jgi:hypothetical protein
VCELEDRLDAAIDEADADDEVGDFAERLSSEEARTGEELVGAACGRRYTFEQREHTIKLLGKQVMPSQVPGILIQFKVFDAKNAPSVWWAYHMRREMRVAVLVLAAAAAANPEVISTTFITHLFSPLETDLIWALPLIPRVFYFFTFFQCPRQFGADGPFLSTNLSRQ